MGSHVAVVDQYDADHWSTAENAKDLETEIRSGIT
jgi:hypothetical protein